MLIDQFGNVISLKFFCTVKTFVRYSTMTLQPKIIKNEHEALFYSIRVVDRYWLTEKSSHLLAFCIVASF